MKESFKGNRTSEEVGERSKDLCMQCLVTEFEFYLEVMGRNRERDLNGGDLK